MAGAMRKKTIQYSGRHWNGRCGKKEKRTLSCALSWGTPTPSKPTCSNIGDLWELIQHDHPKMRSWLQRNIWIHGCWSMFLYPGMATLLARTNRSTQKHMDEEWLRFVFPHLITSYNETTPPWHTRGTSMGSWYWRTLQDLYDISVVPALVFLAQAS